MPNEADIVSCSDSAALDIRDVILFEVSSLHMGTISTFLTNRVYPEGDMF